MDNTSATILAVSLIIIMLGMGLSLTVADFKRVLKFPKAVAVGLLNQIVLLPLIGFVLVLSVDPEIAMGVMLIAACPGGPTSNLLTNLAKGDVALSVTLTAINSLITIVTIPLIVAFSMNHFFAEEAAVSSPAGEIIKTLIVVIAFPLALGMLINKLAPKLAAKADKPVRIFSATLLAIIILALVAKFGMSLFDYFASALVITLALNILTMATGYFSAKVGQLDFRQRLTIAIESGNQNGTLAITIAVAVLQKPEFTIPAVVYSLIMYGTALVPIRIGTRNHTA